MYMYMYMCMYMYVCVYIYIYIYIYTYIRRTTVSMTSGAARRRSPPKSRSLAPGCRVGVRPGSFLILSYVKISGSRFECSDYSMLAATPLGTTN